MMRFSLIYVLFSFRNVPFSRWFSFARFVVLSICLSPFHMRIHSRLQLFIHCSPSKCTSFDLSLAIFSLPLQSWTLSMPELNLNVSRSLWLLSSVNSLKLNFDWFCFLLDYVYFLSVFRYVVQREFLDPHFGQGRLVFA